jgi:hypothetical protein
MHNALNSAGSMTVKILDSDTTLIHRMVLIRNTASIVNVDVDATIMISTFAAKISVVEIEIHGTCIFFSTLQRR